MRIGALLIHGLTSTPGEMAPLANLLQSQGIVCRAPLLPGHGTTISELGSTSRHQWIESIIGAHRDLQREVDQIFCIGESLGGLLALVTSARVHYRGIVVLSVPFEIVRNQQLLQILSYLPDALLARLWTQKKVRRGNHHLSYANYDSHHVGAAARLFQLRRDLIAAADVVNAPLLILQDPFDDHLAASASHNLARLYREVQVEEYPHGAHQLICGPRSEEVCTRIVRFIEENR